MTIKKSLIILTGFLQIVSGTAFAEPHNVFGTYLTEDKGSKIRIQDCGDGSPCGTVTWLNPESFEEGEDIENFRSKSGELIIGLEIVKGFKRKKNDWRGGTIYSPSKDKTYASRLKSLENGTLEVKGCISFFCETQIWTPVD